MGSSPHHSRVTSQPSRVMLPMPASWTIMSSLASSPLESPLYSWSGSCLLTPSLIKSMNSTLKPLISSTSGIVLNKLSNKVEGPPKPSSLSLPPSEWLMTPTSWILTWSTFQRRWLQRNENDMQRKDSVSTAEKVDIWHLPVPPSQTHQRNPTVCPACQKRRKTPWGQGDWRW